MADFPTLSVSGPDSKGFSEQFSDAGDLVSSTEAGYKISRRQFTRRPRTFTMTYMPLTDADKATLDTFIDTHGTTGQFNWLHPITTNLHVVRFVKIPKLERLSIYWQMSCELEEV